MRYLLLLGIFFSFSISTATAAEVRGQVVATEGHISPSCRTMLLKRKDNGQIQAFRIPDTGADQSILSVTLTALTAGVDVIINYDPGVTTGCGTEPRITIIQIFAQGN
ncbi:hypothetical protein [Asticcacaulis sp. 201]|uniref:hypothetical protein n=1 Tax=Asticcacaulis sp. 201 TaxID=3028787 RepID=UPI002916B38E|nr:hypothetical protein [Asticcacaulis sp. 201]MDV6331325.1 hypothetical protein [Asticcacaulis sp. 201]